MIRSRIAAAARVSRSSGFTLLETLISVSLLAVTMAIAVPSMRDFLLDSRRAASGNDLVATLTVARGQAVIDRTAVTVCRSENPLSKTPSCAVGGGWESGWISFVDRDADGQLDDGEPVLQQHEALPGGTTVKGNSKVLARVTFKPSGTTSNNGSFALCDIRGWGGAARVIVVATSGRVRTTSPAQPVDNPLTSCTPSA